MTFIKTSTLNSSHEDLTSISLVCGMLIGCKTVNTVATKQIVWNGKDIKEKVHLLAQRVFELANNYSILYI
jgi:hypothetical protein